MIVLAGVDLGTSKIASLAIDAESGEVLSRASVANDAEITTPTDKMRGRSEWDAGRIVRLGEECLADLAREIGSHSREMAGIGITGQQHGVVLVDRNRQRRTPLINWQDRRATDEIPAIGRSYLEAARDRLGKEAISRTGCRLYPGFLGLTLFWMKQNGVLPSGSTACFMMDLFGADLTGGSPITEPSCAGSSGVFDVHARQWDFESIHALDLPRELFAEVREADQALGKLTAEAAARIGIPAGIPVFAPIGDHQASFIGSVGNLREDVLVNVGTGAQVAAYTDADQFVPPAELRPFPIRGNLLSNVGLAGGWSYQVLEHFFRRVADEVFEVGTAGPIYAALNRLAAAVPAGCDGLVCEPQFAGTRADPGARGAFTGVTVGNLTPGHFARAALEGMARSLADGYRVILETGTVRSQRLLAAGNALRENDVLRESVRNAFGLPMAFTRHREEAAFGAALAAAVGAGILPSLEEAGRLIHYE